MTDMSPVVVDRHYSIPDGNVQIAFSGGRTSAYMLKQILDANGGGLQDLCVVTFQNTGLEMPETLDFVQECADRWGVHVVWLEYAPRRALRSEELDLVRAAFGDAYAAAFAEWWARSQNPDGFNVVSHNSAARNGEPFLALILLRKFLPNQQSRFCTVELKIRTAKRYLRSLGWDYWTNCVGLRADEPRRIKPEGVKLKDRWTVWQPLNHAGVTKRTVTDFWALQSFDLRLPNVRGNCWLGNCHGCFLKSEASVAALSRDYPALAAWWQSAEALVQSMWPQISPWGRLRRLVSADPELSQKLREGYGRPVPQSVIRSIVEQPRSAGQFSKRYSRKELADFVERQGDWIFDDDDFLCQKDGGECTW